MVLIIKNRHWRNSGWMNWHARRGDICVCASPIFRRWLRMRSWRRVI